MVQQSVAKSVVVEIEGRPLPAALANTLVEGHVDDSRTLPGVFLLRFRDPGRVLLQQGGIKVGGKVRLMARAGAGTSGEPLLTGCVTALEVEIDDTGTFTVVRGMDDSYRLFRGRRVASYQNMTVADICSQVARRAGLKTGTIDVAGPVLEHVAQPGISDWEFVRGLAAEAGAQAYVDDGKLHITRPTPASGAPDTSARADKNPLVLEMGDNLLRCRAGVSAAEQVTTVEVRGWDVRTAQPLIGKAPANRTGTLELGITPAQVAQPFGEAGYLVSDGAYRTQAEVDQAAKALAERIASSFGELEAVIRGNPSVRAGGAVTLTGVGAPFEGRYTVTSARHVFHSARGYETWISVSGQQERTLSGLTGATGGAGRGGGTARCAGLVNGTVTDTKDPEGLGRVKVRFPWLSDEYATDWARTAQANGLGDGESFIPEIGDEVLIGFDQGRLDHPYVLASLYNGKDKPGRSGAAADGKPVDGTTGAVNKRAFGSKKGKLEVLDAADGNQGVRLSTEGGKLTIDLDRKGTTIVVHSDGTVEIDAKETVSVKAGSGVTVDAGNGALELTGDSVKVTARNGVEVQGRQVSVNGTASTELKGGRTLSVKAGLVEIN
ncbi:VgrG-related protein [Streptomyces pactum]|uniref:VgrG-related protein n=1 Tax=Streptomyces pactum TaxID=68249 RepID=A0ABS0NEP5_9ACTN|nr:VgrG-related protein [Streptomyces pactum]MBH5333669.1 VgrG-related protein [Streptomyces pactum]